MLARDGRAAEDQGLQSESSYSLMPGVDLPLNLEDGDIYPEMKALPPPRKTWTCMTLSLTNFQTARAWAQLSREGRLCGATPREDVRARIVCEAQS